MQILQKVSYCGLSCCTCPVYWATVEEDTDNKNKMRTVIAQFCNDMYGMNYTYNDISDCLGCKSKSGVLFKGCSSCEVRNCAIEKGLENCAHCPDYICEKLQKLIIEEPNRKISLEVIRSIL